jgi:hypothetical protein
MYDLFLDSEEVRQTDGLKQAYEQVQTAMRSDSTPLEYWKTKTQNLRRAHHTPQTSESEEEVDEEVELDSDPEIREVQLRSLADHKASRGSALPTPTPSESPSAIRKPRVTGEDIRQLFAAKKAAASSSKRQYPSIQKGDVVEGDMYVSRHHHDDLPTGNPPNFLWAGPIATRS